jgi:DNA-binding winged helix-turn-helix (wHTH) protein
MPAGWDDAHPAGSRQGTVSMTKLPAFQSLATAVLNDLAAARCVAIIGLSNSGKSHFLASLAHESLEQQYQQANGRRLLMVYVDCNRAVALTGQAFYEVVLRAAIERLEPFTAADLATSLSNHHQSIIEASSAFSASLAFNLAMSELCEHLGPEICLLIDEFDELYGALDDRVLLNLRALYDRFRTRLHYVTATLRSLPSLRGRSIEDEFAEIFAHSTYPMPLLSLEELRAALAARGPDFQRQVGMVEACFELSGGHPGLMVAVSETLRAHSEWLDRADLAARMGREPQPRAECLKIWSQLNEEERAALLTLLAEAETRLAPQQMAGLHQMGLLREGLIFSPIFSAFVKRLASGGRAATEGVHVDRDSGEVWVDGVRIPVLTDLEFRLLGLLCDRRDKLTDKYQIVTEVWGENYLGDVDDARVEKLVSRLRGKIEPEPTVPRYLITRRGRGYQLLSKPLEKSSG